MTRISAFSRKLLSGYCKSNPITPPKKQQPLDIAYRNANSFLVFRYPQHYGLSTCWSIAHPEISTEYPAETNPLTAHGWQPGMLEKNVLRVCDGMKHQRRPIAEKANHQSNYLTRSSTKQGVAEIIDCLLLGEPLEKFTTPPYMTTGTPIFETIQNCLCHRASNQVFRTSFKQAQCSLDVWSCYMRKRTQAGLSCIYILVNSDRWN